MYLSYILLVHIRRTDKLICTEMSLCVKKRKKAMKFGGRNLHSLDEVKRSESHIFQVADVWASLYLFAARESGRQEEAETKIKKITKDRRKFLRERWWPKPNLLNDRWQTRTEKRNYENESDPSSASHFRFQSLGSKGVLAISLLMVFKTH